MSDTKDADLDERSLPQALAALGDVLESRGHHYEVVAVDPSEGFRSQLLQALAYFGVEADAGL